MASERLLLTVPTFFGTEATLAHEIRSLGYETTEVTDGRITFEDVERAAEGIFRKDNLTIAIKHRRDVQKEVSDIIDEILK